METVRTLTHEQVTQIIPHRDPMLLIDTVSELVEGERITASFYVDPGREIFKGHFPGDPIMPGVLMIEAMAQVGGVALLYPEENRGKIAVFGKIDNVRFRKQIIPGDQVITEAIITKIRGNMGVCECKGRVDGKVACECECTFAIMDAKK